MGAGLTQAFKAIRRGLANFRDRIAVIESALYCVRRMPNAPSFDDRYRFLAAMLAQARPDGLFLEFGVAGGQTINFIAEQKPDTTIYGFDCFSGLPEDWRKGWPKGTFAQTALPKVRGNCQLIVGLFADTLPPFMREKNQPIAFMHVDCDLYASAKTVLTQCAPFIGPGTVIVFDEYFNYPAWKKHEHRAWQEFCRDHDVCAEPIGLIPADMQAAFRIGSK